MTKLLRGPKDPEAFRVQVNRTRWYRDPLPADSKWPAMTEAVPAMTTIKSAWSKPFKKKTPTGLVVPLDAYRAAAYVQDNLNELAGMHPDEVFMQVATAPDRDLAKAANRGTALHSVFEALAVGQRLAPELHDDAVRPFLPACEAFVDEWRPVWRMTEFVVINRALGFAGTADALAELDGTCTTCGEPLGLTVIDYKSRGSGHGAYEEEVCQLGGYASGEYIVITNDAGSLERIDPPGIRHGAIVSITADDGYRLYPIEIADARHAFLGMFETWRIKRDGTSVARKAIGKPAMSPSRAGDNRRGDQYHAEQQPLLDGQVANLNDRTEQRAEQTSNNEAPQHLPTPVEAGSQPPPHDPQAEIEAAVAHAGNEQQPGHRMVQTIGDTNGDRCDSSDDGKQLPSTEQEATEPRSDAFDFGHVRSRVEVIKQAAAGRPLPALWPNGTPTFKSGGVTAEHLPAIAEWCDVVEAAWRLPFPPPAPGELDRPQPAAPDPQPAAPRHDHRAEAEEWAARGRALLSLLHDEPLARACARTARCDTALMSRVHYLALQAVVSQMSEPAGVLVAHWSGEGVELRAVNDMEKALLAQMPVDGIITKATKLDALQRGKRIAKRLGVQPPKTYDDLCSDLMLAACVAVGHGVKPDINE